MKCFLKINCLMYIGISLWDYELQLFLVGILLYSKGIFVKVYLEIVFEFF